MSRLFFLVFIIISLALACCRAPSPQALDPPSPDQKLAVQAEDRIQAGQMTFITAGPAPVPDGTAATLLLQGSYGPQITTSEFLDKVVSFQLEPSLTQQAGLVTLIVTTPGYYGTAEMIIESGSPVEPVTPLVGARSIVADGEHWSMAVVVPFDQYNNPIADGTPFSIEALHPGNQLETITNEIANLVGWARIYSGTQAGRTSIAVTVEGVPGPEGTLLEVPGAPLPFDLSAEPSSLPADGRLLTTVHTTVLVDQFGNELLDGTKVTFKVEDEDGSIRLLPSYTINGVAETSLQASLLPSVVNVTASVLGVTSRPLQIVFSETVRSFPVEVMVDTEDDVIQLIAGPVLGNLGQFMPDGTSVFFTATTVDGTTFYAESEIDRGFALAELRLAELVPDTYEVRAQTGDAIGTASFTIQGN